MIHYSANTICWFACTKVPICNDSAADSLVWWSTVFLEISLSCTSPTLTSFQEREKEREREIQLLLIANTQQHSTMCIAYYYVRQEKNKLQEAQHGRTAPTKCTSSSKRIDIPSQSGGGVELHGFVQCVMTRYRLLPRHSHRTASWHINLCTCFATGQHWVECYAGKTTIGNRAK